MSAKRILVVEDDGLVAEGIRIMLHGLGYESPQPAASGLEALKAVQTEAPHLILMDVRLQGSMDGIDAAHALNRQCNLPIVFLTAHSDPDTLARAKGAYPFGYLVKPVAQADLHVAIEVALEKHRADRVIRDYEFRVRQVKQHLLEGVLAKREEFERSLRRQLHEDIAQNFSALMILLQQGQKVRTVSDARALFTTAAAIGPRVMANIRTAIDGLRPAMLDELGLSAALDFLVQRILGGHPFAVDAALEQISVGLILPEVETALYRIVEESLTNIVQHSQARAVRLRMTVQPTELRLEIHDDGRGFDAQALLGSGDPGEFAGVALIRERAAVISAGLAISSAPGEGTTIIVTVPLADAAKTEGASMLQEETGRAV